MANPFKEREKQRRTLSDLPERRRVEPSTIEEQQAQEQVKPEPTVQESTKPEPSVQESAKLEPTVQESAKLEQTVQKAAKPEPAMQEALQQEGANLEPLPHEQLIQAPLAPQEEGLSVHAGEASAVRPAAVKEPSAPERPLDREPAPGSDSFPVTEVLQAVEGQFEMESPPMESASAKAKATVPELPSVIEKVSAAMEQSPAPRKAKPAPRPKEAPEASRTYTAEPVMTQSKYEKKTIVFSILVTKGLRNRLDAALKTGMWRSRNDLIFYLLDEGLRRMESDPR